MYMQGVILHKLCAQFLVNQKIEAIKVDYICHVYVIQIRMNPSS